MNKKVLDGTEVDVQVLKEEEEDEDEENLQSERFQKWEVLPESFISRKSCYKKRRLEWMKISYPSNFPWMNISSMKISSMDDFEE